MVLLLYGIISFTVCLSLVLFLLPQSILYIFRQLSIATVQLSGVTAPVPKRPLVSFLKERAAARLYLYAVHQYLILATFSTSNAHCGRNTFTPYTSTLFYNVPILH